MKQAHIIDLVLILNFLQAVRSYISDVLSAPEQDHAILSAGCKEHTLVISDCKAVYWIFMLVQSIYQATHWTEPVNVAETRT
jgi:hypothetical protein